MPYTLITSTGRIMQFYIRALADTYAISEGGVVCGEEVLLDTAPIPCYITAVLID
jgi:hypothetical protein